jgi:hypothetical protein
MLPEHHQKVDELIETMASTLRITVHRLYHCGGIDPDSYDTNNYVLAKILVTAAMRHHVDDFAPPFEKEDIEAVKNLQYF